jgi:UDP-N-acetylmuramate dehydrogenase
VLTITAEPLARWTTLRLGGPARAFAEAPTRAELFEAVAAADAGGETALILGGGSNLVVADEGFDGLAIRVTSSGISMNSEGSAGVELTVEAGESWERLVALAAGEGWAGIEALAGIPGTVGATPIQNVGAYGQEVCDSIVQVLVYDRQQRQVQTLTAAQCGFGYRTSLFKQAPGRYVVGAVRFRFRRSAVSAPVRYTELAGRLGIEVGSRASTADVRSAVLDLRAAKGMVLDPDDHDTWSAGSFFTNPVLPPDALPAGAPAFPAAQSSVKTSAAWLIEHAGFRRGYGGGQVRVSTKHTLALTNRGAGSTADLLALAREIRAGVREKFGIELQLEPVLVGCSLDPA